VLISSFARSPVLVSFHSVSFSGVGLCAAKLLALVNPHNRIVLVGRTMEKALEAKQEVVSVMRMARMGKDALHQHITDGNDDCEDRVIALACDHCSLSSVKDFCDELRRTLEATYRREYWQFSGIDALCLNAAVLVEENSRPQFTVDGLETTFQTNHLAPFLIANFVLAENLMNPGGRIVFSTSGLHVGAQLNFDGAIDVDDENTLTTDAMKVNRRFEMLDGTDFHFKRAYAISKLCNVATCAELSDLLRSSSKHVIVNCFSPGFIPSSGLFRHQDLDAFRKRGHGVCVSTKTVEWGAGALVFMAVAGETGIRGCDYWSDTTPVGCSAQYGKHFRPTPITDGTVGEGKRRTLWKLSCQLADIPSERL